ncbi:hypothetical protein N7491_004052, partial [Penicillium cf. griseofulvum]
DLSYKAIKVLRENCYGGKHDIFELEILNCLSKGDINHPVEVVLSDWGAASWESRHLSTIIQPTLLRAPEVILQASLGKEVDIWNLGALLPELLDTVRMFSGRSDASGGEYLIKHHVEEINALFGPFPSSLQKEGKPEIISQIFDENFRIKDPTRKTRNMDTPYIKGSTTCYEKVDTNYSNCVNNSCAGGGQECYNSCGGSTSCMNEKCPGLGIDCIKACECEKSALQINCAGQSCWNQVYFCEYQSTATDFLNVCLNPNQDGLPYWLTPDDAPDSCSCNLGKVEIKNT